MQSFLVFVFRLKFFHLTKTMLKNIRHPSQNEVEVFEHPCSLMIDEKPQGTGCIYVCRDKLVWVNQHFLGVQLYYERVQSYYKACNEESGCVVLSYSQTKFQNQQSCESDDDDVIGTRACDFFDSKPHTVKIGFDSKVKVDRVFECISRYDDKSVKNDVAPKIEPRFDSLEFMLESAAQSQQIDEQNLDSLNFK